MKLNKSREPRGLNKEYDERQLKIRGDIYQRGFIIALVLVSINGALAEFDVRWASPFWSTLIVMMLAVDITVVEMILRDAYIGVRSRYSATYLMVTDGLCAAAVIGLNLAIVLTAKEPFAKDGILSLTGAQLIFWGLQAAIPLALLGKKIAERGKRGKEEEE